MGINEVKLLFKHGDITGVTLTRDALSGGYQAIFSTSLGIQPLTTQRGSIRAYKCISTAIEHMEVIGFKALSIQL